MKIKKWCNVAPNSKLISLVLIGLLVPMIAGCAAANGILTAANIAMAAESVLLPVNAEAAEYVAETATDLRLLSDMVSAVQKAPSGSGKQVIITQIQNVTRQISARLPKILTAVHIKSPQLSQQISVAVGIFNAALAIVAQYVPQAGQQSIIASNMPMASGAENKGKNSVAQFREQWNAVAPQDARVK